MVVSSELALAALAVADVWHALSNEADELSGLQQSLRLRAAADALAVHEHARYLRHIPRYQLMHLRMSSTTWHQAIMSRDANDADSLFDWQDCAQSSERELFLVEFKVEPRHGA